MGIKEFRQLWRDRRTLGLLVFMPLVLLLVFGHAASFDVDEIPTLVVGQDADEIAERGVLPDALAPVDTETTWARTDAEDQLRDGRYVVALVATDEPAMLVDGSQLFSARAVQSATRAAPGLPEAEILYNPNLETPTVMVPALIGLILLFVGTVATSLGVVRERQAGTLEQLAVMPLRPRQVFLGKILPYLLVAMIDMAIIVVAGVWVFDVPFEGSVLVFAGASALFLFVTLGTGVLISTVSHNQGQAIQLAIMALLPQVLLSGMIFPIESMPRGPALVSLVLPLTYFVDIARGVMLRGAPLESIVTPLASLAVLGIIVCLLAVLRFRKDLAPKRSAAPPPTSETEALDVPVKEGAR